MSKKKKKKVNILSLAEKARREKEIEKYGRLLSLRPSVEHKSKKQYTRKEKHKNEITAES